MTTKMKTLITIAIAALSLLAMTAGAEAKAPTPQKSVPIEAPPVVKASHGGRAQQRASVSTLTGVVTASGQRQANASVTLQYWNGSRFVSLAGSFRTNSSGVYAINVYSGFYYRVQAAKMIGRCPGSFTQWLGVSGWTGTSTGYRYNLPVAMQYQGGITC